MATAGLAPTHIVLIGLDETLAGELRKTLSGLPTRIDSTAFDTQRVDWEQIERADCIFGPSDVCQLEALLEAVHDRCPGTPVIAVSRHPEDAEWIRAMEAGATDYCAAPFEPHQMDWILRNTLTFPVRTVAVV